MKWTAPLFYIFLTIAHIIYALINIGNYIILVFFAPFHPLFEATAISIHETNSKVVKAIKEERIKDAKARRKKK